MTTNYLFEVVNNQNCRKYLKKCYYLKVKITHDLIPYLSDFGFLEMQEFSKFSPIAKDCFKISVDENLYINGVIDEYLLYLTVSKANENFVPIFEQKLVEWLLNNKH
jgi:hypothetical protein